MSEAITRFTVITPTYNRAHTLRKVFDSLNAQTFRDFEWVIADDGSTDGTRELVAGWKASFPIRYFWKPNAGKHTAMNLGVSVARGELVLFFDSDDCCRPHALERFDYHWQRIPDPSRFWNLCCLCAMPDGAIVGNPFPAECVDAVTFADQIRYFHSGPWGSTQEKWGVNRTDLLRQCPWPEGERYAPESLVWNRLARKYASRFINEALRIYEPNLDGISRNVTDLRISSPKGTLTYYRELALSPAPAALRARAAINFCRFAALTAPRRLRTLLSRRSSTS